MVFTTGNAKHSLLGVYEGINPCTKKCLGGPLSVFGIYLHWRLSVFPYLQSLDFNICSSIPKISSILTVWRSLGMNFLATTQGSVRVCLGCPQLQSMAWQSHQRVAYFLVKSETRLEDHCMKVATSGSILCGTRQLWNSWDNPEPAQNLQSGVLSLNRLSK